MLSDGELRVYKALYLNKEGIHIRAISKYAELTLPAVVKHINKGEEKGIISCETKGRMKICRLSFESKKLIPMLQEVELSRFNDLPSSIGDSFNDFLNDLQEKPLIALIFGSFAEGKHVKTSDLDVLLVFQHIDDKLMKKIEFSASKIRGRTAVNVQPVSISYNEFQRELLNLENEFMKDVRKSALVVYGIESYINVVKRFYS